MNLRVPRAATLISVLLLSAVLALSSMPARGMSHLQGAYWTYDMDAAIEVVGLVAEVSGHVTYSFEGTRTHAFSGTDYSVNVMDINGSLEGYVQLIGQTNASSRFVVEGIQYEDSRKAGTLESNLTFLGSVTFVAGAISFTNAIVNTEDTTAVPSVLSRFDPSNIHLGASWTQVVSETSTKTTWQNQALANYTFSWQSVVYDVQVAAAAEAVDTPAGSFNAVKVTASAGSAEAQQLWWSSEVGNFVKQEFYENGSSAPVMSLNLTAYGAGSMGGGLIVPLIGLVVLAIAVLVLVVVLMRRRGPEALSLRNAGSSRTEAFEREGSQDSPKR